MSEPNWAGAPVIPVVVIDDPAQGPPLARALLAGGVGIVEVTLRTDGALGAIARIRSEVPEIWVGAGTIRGNDDIDRALQAGAQFLVSPGTTAALRAGLIAAEVPSLPGVATIGEAMTALDEGFPVVKIFPISALGGRDLVRALAAVLPELGVCPTGGLDPRSAADFSPADPNAARHAADRVPRHDGCEDLRQ